MRKNVKEIGTQELAVENVIEAVRRGEQVPLQKLFDEVNRHDFTSVTLQDGDKTIVGLDVNHYEEYDGTHEFSQDVTDGNKFCLDDREIVVYEAQVIAEGGLLFIDCALADGKHFKITTLLMNGELPERNEISVHELMELLQEDSSYMKVWISALTGFELQMNEVQADLCDDGGIFPLEITDNMGTELNVPLYDDSCNYIYKEETDLWTVIRIKPNGMPFTEIKMLVVK